MRQEQRGSRTFRTSITPSVRSSASPPERTGGSQAAARTASPSGGVPPDRLQRLQEGHQIRLFLLREPHLEAKIVEGHCRLHGAASSYRACTRREGHAGAAAPARAARGRAPRIIARATRWLAARRWAPRVGALGPAFRLLRPGNLQAIVKTQVKLREWARAVSRPRQN